MGTSLQIHDKRILERCLKDQSISEENRKVLNEFDAFLKAVQRRVGTRKNYILVAWQLAKVLGEIPFREDNDEDEKKLIGFINLLREGSEEFGWKPLWLKNEV